MIWNLLRNCCKIYFSLEPLGSSAAHLDQLWLTAAHGLACCFISWNWDKYLLSYLASTSEVTEIAHPVRTLDGSCMLEDISHPTEFFRSLFQVAKCSNLLLPTQQARHHHMYLMAFFFSGCSWFTRTPRDQRKARTPSKFTHQFLLSVYHYMLLYLILHILCLHCMESSRRYLIPNAQRIRSKLLLFLVTG